MEEELSEWEQEALKRMEAKFALSAESESPYINLPMLIKEKIRGTEFLSYSNVNMQYDSSNAPILIYSEKNRFRYILNMIVESWASELADLIELIIQAEKELSQSDEVEMELEQELSSFGMDVTHDGYTVGYPGGSSSPIFMARDLLAGILNLYFQSAISVQESGSILEGVSLPSEHKMQEFIEIVSDKMKAQGSRTH